MSDGNQMQDAWTTHFTTLLRHNLDHHSNLILQEEKAQIINFLDELSLLEQHIYIRIFNRKGPWFKTTSILPYFNRFHSKLPFPFENKDNITVTLLLSNKHVQETLHRLSNLKYIQVFQPDSGTQAKNKDILLSLEALESCCSLPELLSIYKKLKGTKSRNEKVISSKASLIANIRRIILTQRRLDGSYLPVQKFMQQIWAAPSISDCSSHYAFKISEDIRAFFFRMHRLFYLVSISYILPIPPAFADFPTALCSGLSSFQHESIQWPGLLVRFNKVRYPLVDEQVECARKSAMFSHRNNYLRYEIACQLHRLMQYFRSSESALTDLETLSCTGNEDSLPQIQAFVKSQPESELSQSPTECLLSQFYSVAKQFCSFDAFILKVLSSLRMYREAFPSQHIAELPVFLRKYNAGYLLTKILHEAVAVYEKQKRYEFAEVLLHELLDPIDNFGLERKRGHWYTRLAVILQLHLKRPKEDIVRVCSKALEEDKVNDTYSIIGGTRLALQRRLNKLLKQKCDDKENLYSTNHEFMQGRPLNRQMGEKSRFIGYDDEPCTVEQLVLQKVREDGYYGVHCEGIGLRTVLGLLLWDILYLSSINDVFQTAYQDAPLDFGFANVFYQNRKTEIDSRLSTLEAMSLSDITKEMYGIWSEHCGKVSRFVSWTKYPLRFYQLIVLALGNTRLVALCSYMLKSNEYHERQCSGLPDLLLLRVRQKGTDGEKDVNVYEFCNMRVSLNRNERGIEDEHDFSSVEKEMNGDLIVEMCLMEVKGPRDRLSDQQIAWLCVLNEELRITAKVMHVLEEESSVLKKVEGRTARKRMRGKG